MSSRPSDTVLVDRLRDELSIDRELLARWSRPAGWRLLAATLREWALILAAAMLSRHAHALWAAAAAIVFIGTRQHALLVLMHEFSHRQFSRTRAGLNDGLGDFLTALPFGITIHGFRRDHQAHHRNTGTHEDPNWVSLQRQPRYQAPMSRGRFASELAMHLAGVYTVREIRSYLFDQGMAVRSPSATRGRQMAMGVAVVGITALLHGWAVLATYWLLPLFTVLIALLYLRDIAEHVALPSQAYVSRSTIASRLERWLVASHHVGLHAEHHLFSSVPWHRLPEVHRLLATSATYREHVALTRGYFGGVVREFTACRSTSPG
jgi:fatty acid desaturase